MKLEILNGLSIHRIDQDMIKMTDAEPGARGGQATVTIGNITVPEKLPTLVSEEALIKLVHAVKGGFQTKLAVKKFIWDRTDDEQSAKSFKVKFLLMLPSPL